jgi:asparagine synthase (glutamine-hydrolysing)
MTAIAGLWRFSRGPEPADSCARMLAAQEIYARDSAAQWTDGTVALGRGLSLLLPEDAYDHQPLAGAQGRYILVADVRLDNRDELARALAIGPVSARMCDAALLLAAFERWDNDCHDRIIGDYAFALWDAAVQRLVLARSPFGQRPLHFHRGNGFFAFASMPKGLHALADIPYAPDEEKFAEFVALLPDAGTRSFFAGIERVPPGHFAVVTANGLSLQRHWQPQRRRLRLSGSDAYVEAMRHHLDQAVRCRLRGADRIGATLSAGLDSAAVTATAARLLQPSGGKVIAFTATPRAGYDGPVPARRLADEGPLAALTAAMHPNVEHVLVRAGACAPLDALDRSFVYHDQPSLLLMSWGMAFDLNDAARARQIKVLLTGGLGNTTFSYDGLALLPELLGRGRFLALAREMRALVAGGAMSWRGALGRSVGAFLPPALWQLLHRVGAGAPAVPAESNALNPAHRTKLALAARQRGLDLSFLPRRDSFALRAWMLTRADNGNRHKAILGGWGIDVRNPLTDRRLVEFSLSVPTEQFLANGEMRALARRALADQVPRAVLDAPRRGYQAADWHEGAGAARGLLAAEIERLAQCPAAARTLDLPRMRELLQQWPAGGWERTETTMAYRQMLLGGISAGHFLRRASGANA